jgi:hypothetical protein
MPFLVVYPIDLQFEMVMLPIRIVYFSPMPINKRISHKKHVTQNMVRPKLFLILIQVMNNKNQNRRQAGYYRGKV